MKDSTARELLEKVKDDYDNIANEFDQTRQHDWKEFNLFLKYINDDDKIADLGCGNGRFYEFLRKNRKIREPLKNTGSQQNSQKLLRYTGIDNNKKLLNMAKSKLKSDKNAKFLEGDLLKTGLEKSSIDMVAAIASFHHLPGKEIRKKSLLEINRILKNKGKLIISVWNLFQTKYKKFIWKARIRRILSLGKYDWRDTFIPWGKSGTKRYYYAFKANELEKLLKENGFKIIEKFSANNLVFICEKQ